MISLLHLLAIVVLATLAGVVAGYIMGHVDGRFRGYIAAHEDLNRDRRARMDAAAGGDP